MVNIPELRYKPHIQYNTNRVTDSDSGTVSAREEAAKSSDDLSKTDFFTALNNQFTGDLDYRRSIESAMRAEEVSAREASKAREWSANEAKVLRDWQEYMSNTAYSRAVADLKSVGINPYAIGLFKAASTPSGAYGSSFAGSSDTGNNYHTGSTGFGAVFDIVETLLKEVFSTYRNNANILAGFGIVP